jgi:hypothetical protein
MNQKELSASNPTLNTRDDDVQQAEAIRRAAEHSRAVAEHSRAGAEAKRDMA